MQPVIISDPVATGKRRLAGGSSLQGYMLRWQNGIGRYDGRMMKMSVIITFLRTPSKLTLKINSSHHIVRNENFERL
jgi:hypothetical protein